MINNYIKVNLASRPDDILNPGLELAAPSQCPLSEDVEQMQLKYIAPEKAREHGQNPHYHLEIFLSNLTQNTSFDTY